MPLLSWAPRGSRGAFRMALLGDLKTTHETTMTTSTNETSSAIAAQRREAVQDLLADARGIIAEKGVTRGALKAISELLLDLATRHRLFGATDFPPPQPDSGDTATRASASKPIPASRCATTRNTCSAPPGRSADGIA